MQRILRGAEVVDGTGRERRSVDVLIDGDVITEVGDLGRMPSVESIDLNGLVLSPGFIDVHTHLDAQVFWDPDLSPSPSHGVTTVILGNCGFGIAPTRPRDRELILRTFENAEAVPLATLEAGVRWEFETFPEYLDVLEGLPKRINVAALLGHTPLRYFVMGREASEREATAAEVDEVIRLARGAVEAGAIGIATSKNDVHYGAFGLPVPSRLASMDELLRLAQLLDEAGHGVLTIAAGKTFSLPEIAEVAASMRQPLSWESVFTGYDARDQFGSAPAGTALSLLEQSAALGDNLWPQVSCRPVVLQITLDAPYPMIAYCQAFREVTAERGAERLALYRSEEWRARARSDLGERADIMWRRISVQETGLHHDAVGVNLRDLGVTRGVDPLDLLLDLALEEDLSTRFRMVLMNDDVDELAQILTHDHALLAGSDAGAHLSQLCDSCFSSSLLEHWVREAKVLSLEEAVWKMTGQPSAVFGLHRRGTIEPGNIADLVAFDPDRVGVAPMERVWDLPGGADRMLIQSVGIEHVWVSGRAIRTNGADVTGSYPGELVRGRRA